MVREIHARDTVHCEYEPCRRILRNRAIVEHLSSEGSFCSMGCLNYHAAEKGLEEENKSPVPAVLIYVSKPHPYLNSLR